MKEPSESESEKGRSAGARRGIHPGGIAGVAGAVILAFLLGFVVRPWIAGDDDGGSAGGGAAAAEAPRVNHWTCSMHPDVVRQEKGLCPKCAMELVPVYAEDVSDAEAPLRQLRLSPAAVALAGIQTSAVERRFVEVPVRMVGKVAYDETLLYHVTAWVPGRIDRLFVDYTGIAVREGDHMVDLYSPELLQAQEELLEARRSVRLLETQGSPQSLERARRTLRAAEEKLRLWGLLEAQIEEIGERGTPSDHTTIHAPHGGIVVQKSVVQGMYVQTGTRIYTIADLNRVWVMLEAYASDLQWLRYGQKVEFTSEALPGETFEGRISFIEPFLDERTRTVGVRVTVENEDGSLKPDMFVRAVVRARAASGGKVVDPEIAGKWVCRMHPEVIQDDPGRCPVCEMALETVESIGYAAVEPAAAPLVIPSTAPLITGRRAVVYLEVESDAGPTFVGREVVLGPRAGDWYIVRAGLEEGERVVSRGNFKLDSELQIRGKPSMMSPEGSAAATGHAHHDGGAPPSEGGEMEMEPESQVPESFRESLELLLVSLRAVETATRHGDLEAARSACRMLGRARDLVDVEFLGGRALTLWREIGHSLGLGAVEGEASRSRGELRKVWSRLAKDRERLVQAFGPFAGTDPGVDAEHAGHAQADAVPAPSRPEVPEEGPEEPAVGSRSEESPR